MVARNDVIGSIQGQRVVIPDLQSLMSDWPQGQSDEEAKVKQDVRKRLEDVLEPGPRLKKMKAARVETFAATWWPDANHEALVFATYLAIWHSNRFKDTDTPEYTTELVDDMDAAQHFREETLAFVNQCLRVQDFGVPRTPNNRVINSFDAIGDFVRLNFCDGQRRQLHRQLEIWINTTAIEQWHEVTGKMPDIDRYMKDRLGSSAVGVCLGICEYMLRIDLPEVVRHDEDMKCIWDCTNTIISIANDMLSFKKEIAQARLDNLVVLLYLQSGSIQSAMDGAFEQVRKAKYELDKAAIRLLAKYNTSANPDLGRDVQNFVDCCRTMCTGNNTWSLKSERYQLGVESLKGGVEIKL